MRTIEEETNNEAALITRDETVPLPKGGNYEPVRFNAMTHGILSKLTVLAHENHGEFVDLLAALIDEHRPAGITERLLIEELASIIWRKRRVLLAEGASINRGLAQSVKEPRIVRVATPLNYGAAENADLRDLIAAGPEENDSYHRSLIADQDAVHAAKKILRKGSKNAYRQAMAALTTRFRMDWLDALAEDKLAETVDGLAQFIRETIEPALYQEERETRFQPEIKRQVFGEGLRAETMEKLNRYETHLDRKFERTLAMLLKMREIRP